MSTLVSAALTLRRTARLSFGVLAAAAFSTLVLLGVFLVPISGLGIEHASVALAWSAIFGRKVYRRRHAKEGEVGGRWLDLEIGLLMLVAAHALLQLGGGLSGPFYPAIYVLVAFLVSLARRPVGTVLVLGALSLEAGVWGLAEPDADWATFASHGGFIVLFGALNVVFTRAEIVRVRESSRREREDDRRRVQEDARLFRLVGSPSSKAEGDEQKLLVSSLEQVHDSLYHVLDLLKRSLDLHTCVLLLLDEDGKRLRIVELSTDSDEIMEASVGVGEGAVGAVASRGLVMNLENLKRGYKGLPYYRDGADVRCFLGVPVMKSQARGDKSIGALCGDRKNARPFTPQEEQIFKSATGQVLRAMENERLFVQLQRSKQEQTHLYNASQSLGEALTEDEVVDAGLHASFEIAPYDFAAITLYDKEAKRHSIKKAVGQDAERFAELTFRDNTSLTAMVVKNKHYLPYRGEFDPRQQVVFTKRHKIPETHSLLVLPLIVREHALGTLVLAAEREAAFKADLRPTLQVLANQLAVALSNAAAVARLEEMATTDGMTGCLNKRVFKEEFEARVTSAARFGRKLSLLVTDLDHFKHVNDTYGHATGDVVIKELGAILNRVKRETDLVARFGGEEFCILCEETDTDGAVLLAERIREEVSSTVFTTELGKLSVECSIGVATFPQDAETAAELFEITDKALYVAKNNGRNQVCTSAGI